MDEQLAFCVEKFVENQCDQIDEEIHNIEAEESEEIKKIEVEEHRRGPTKDRGLFTIDSKLVEQFVVDIREAEALCAPRAVVDDGASVRALRSEILTKVNASKNYLTRLRNLAKPMPKSKAFVEECNEVISYFSRNEIYESNFQKLCNDLQGVDVDGLLPATQKWWKETYGVKIAAINKKNEKFNQAVVETGFGTIQPASQIVSNGKALLNARTVTGGDEPKVAVLKRFARDVCQLDEDRRNEEGETRVFEKLQQGSVNGAVSFARSWLVHRNEVRKMKDPLEVRRDEVRAEFGRRKIAQGAKKLAIVALARRLAAGSGNEEKFDEQLKEKTQEHSKQNPQSVSVVSRDIGSPEEEDLGFAMNIVVLKTDSDGSSEVSNEQKDSFKNALSKALDIPEISVEIEEVKVEDKVVHGKFRKPYGKKAVDVFNGTASDSVDRMEKLRVECESFGVKLDTITLGEYNLDVEDRLMDPKWNITYRWPNEPNSTGTNYWDKSLVRGGKPYFCPSGWKRYGVNVAKDEKEFDAKWGNWCIAYHGTQGRFASSILTTGLRVSTNGCFYEAGVPRVYVSPSIEYSAHPRYAYPWYRTEKDNKLLWFQLVFQCRVNPQSISKIGPETLIDNDKKNSVIVDKNFRNDELEWVIVGQEGSQHLKDDIICYGMMLRTSEIDPDQLPTSAWWKDAHYSDIYKNT